ncbi:GntR family transcriptional regulator [Lactiplantibacillus paraplantarum]|uniref:GntR family transcriptional regulator n=1 Tax=Lactiplantibacillus paraplantarum TaxID=60520 RepID=UPI0021A851AA|nr:GntR family transcriptional regulator [Lactiplantibacillus paraplantarum]MCT4457908.1 GntR family transcriptional regulator [Lactiplantibacillus paraplantarum]
MAFATNGAPYYEQLVMQIKQQIVQGRLQPGDKLPSIRAMAAEMHLNPNTVSKTYQILESQRAVYTVKGRGTFVSEVSHVAVDPNAVDDLQVRLQALLTEAQFLGVSAQQVQTWVTTAYQKGESHDEYSS